MNTPSAEPPGNAITAEPAFAGAGSCAGLAGDEHATRATTSQRMSVLRAVFFDERSVLLERRLLLLTVLLERELERRLAAGRRFLRRGRRLRLRIFRSKRLRHRRRQLVDRDRFLDEQDLAVG